MKLYVTYTSPYGRLARIVVVEKGLESQVEIQEGPPSQHIGSSQVPHGTSGTNSPYGIRS